MAVSLVNSKTVKTQFKATALIIFQAYMIALLIPRCTRF